LLKDAFWKANTVPLLIPFKNHSLQLRRESLSIDKKREKGEAR